jgi:hypothetical protein
VPFASDPRRSELWIKLDKQQWRQKMTRRSFETEGEAIERGLRRTIEYRDGVTRSLMRAVYRFRDAVLVDDKKGDFANNRTR